AIHNGNLVRTVYGNWGVIGQPSQKGPRGAWIYDTNGYIGDVSPIVGAEVKYHYSTLDTTLKFHSVVVCPIDRPATAREESPSGDQWTFEPVAGYFSDLSEKVAMSTDPASWPPHWPDKIDDPEDSGWPGQWNGFFGKGVTNADQESYFVMDDNNDKEFNNSGSNNVIVNPNVNPPVRGVQFKPDSTNLTRNGLGLEVKVRGLQWQQFLAQDVIFWLYEITNHSTTNYDKVVFGMLAGTYVGVTGTDDSPQEYDDDYSFFDVDRDLTYTGDYPNNNRRNPKWQGSVGLVGYAFLESPGNSYDGIDNDGDNKSEEHPLTTSLIFTAPLFQASDFDSVLYSGGDQVVLIDDNFNRSLHTITNDTETVRTCGQTIQIIAGKTKFIEGNMLTDGSINPNVYDGIDNDLDGLIDENYLLHYRQRRVDQNGVVLFDTLNPVPYKNYRTGQGIYDPLIDERRDDKIDNDGDWNVEFDDVGMDGKAGTFDLGESDGKPTSGESNFDQTDVDESDQIGLTSFNYFTPANDYPMADDEKLWDWLKPGYFDVPSSIQNGKPIAGEDGDFIYGSGYFPLRAGDTERFSLALVYGHNLTDLLKNRETVQKIYDSDYRFPQPPEKPNVSAVVGDGKVTLYWDRTAEASIDPVTKEMDFEGYKIYKATDPDFNDVRVITDINGVVIGYKPLVQFDKINQIKGIFEPSSDLFQEAGGYTFNLGSDNGLLHSYTDTDVENGRRYYYAVVAYDRGDAEKDIYPSENTKFISIQPNGEIITDINTVVVRPGDKVAGYDSQNYDRTLGHLAGPATGYIEYDIIDETQINGHDYRVSFTDCRTDGIDNDHDWNPVTDDTGGIINPDSTSNNGVPDLGEPNFEWKDSDEYAPITSTYSVLDVTGTAETVALDTSYTFLSKHHLSLSSILIARNSDPSMYLSLDDFEFDTLRGKVRINPGSVQTKGDYRISYQYYPIYKSPNIQRSPYATETLDSDIFDGLRLRFSNNWTIDDVDSLSYWNTHDGTLNFSFNTDIVQLLSSTTILVGKPYPSHFEIQFCDSNEFLYQTPQILLDYIYFKFPAFLRPKAKKTNFRVIDLIDSVEVPFLFSLGYQNSLGIYELTNKAQIEMYILRSDSSWYYTWVAKFTTTATERPKFQSGDRLHIETSIPYRAADIFEFTPQLPRVDNTLAKDQLRDIQVVPNPYVVANNMEAPLPPAITSGRGERRIEFRRLPLDSKVHIFTSAGAHVITLNHEGSIHDGTLVWNLKSKENLDVAFGVYFYIVDSEVGKKSGKLAVIK
ncbi:MAG: hypothetical protein V1681_05680, partial [Candidatus Neomarinimicrobiota bacterium]